MSKPSLRTTTMPAEVILDVVRGSRAYKGFALNIIMAGEEVVIMARTIQKLQKVFESQYPGRVMLQEACPEVVLMARAAAQLDEEL